MQKRFFNLFLLLVFIFGSPAARAAGGSDGEFNPGTMIIDHVVDNHEWHIATAGDKQITVPLPIILYDEGKLHVFMSSKFHHGHSDYKGFRLETEGPNKGKIVKVGAPEGAKRPLDLSITKNVAGIFVTIIVLLLVFIPISKRYRENPDRAPKGLQSLLEPLILFVRDDVARPAIGPHYERYMPFLLTTFFFIFFSNLIGLIPFFPGGANVTGSIGVTMVLALFTFLITTFSGNKNYWLHIFNAPGVPWWLKFPIPLMPLIEFIGILIKPFVLMVRLFANITAGHIIVLGFFSLIFIFGNMKPALGYAVSPVSLIMALFISLLELLVAFIQAYVFTMLSAIYFGMATEQHAEAH